MWQLDNIRMNIRARNTMLLLLLVLPGFIIAENKSEPEFWLNRMANASHSLNYEGVFVYLVRGEMQSLKVTHGVDALGEWEKLVTLSGGFREISRKNGWIVSKLPNNKSLVMEDSGAGYSFPVLGQQQIKHLSGFYDFSVQGKERVAGLAARKLSVIPKDNYRYGYNIWLAEDNGLLLRSEMTTEQGDPVEQFIFTSISLREQFHRNPSSTLPPKKAGRKKYLYWHPVAVNREYQWVVAKLPPGFVLTVHRRHDTPTSNKPVEHLVFSDGLASVSVYIENETKNKYQPNQFSRVGAISILTRIIGDNRIVVVGEVPLSTVEYIAESIQKKAAK